MLVSLTGPGVNKRDEQNNHTHGENREQRLNSFLKGKR